jgi:hypothetical protein
MSACAKLPVSNRRHTGFLVAGVGLVGYGLLLSLVQSPRVRDEAARLPRITCAQLLRHGPGPNHYVTVSGARLCSHGFVLDRDFETGSLRNLLHPIYPADLKQEPQPRDLALILRICDDRDSDRLLERPELDEFTCEVRCGPSQLEPYLCEALAAKYPEIRWDQCWVLSVGLHEPTEARAESIWWTGMFLVIVGGLVLAWPAFRLLRRAPSVPPEQAPYLSSGGVADHQSGETTVVRT